MEMKILSGEFNYQAANSLNSLSSRLGAPVDGKRLDGHEAVSNDRRPAADRVSISIEAQALGSALSREGGSAPVDQKKIVDLFTSGKPDVFSELIGQLSEEGEQAPLLKQMPVGANDTRLALAQQAVDHVLKKADNPFSNVSLDSLSNIVLDESGAYTVAERYAGRMELVGRANGFANDLYSWLSAAEYDRDGLPQVYAQLREIIDSISAMPATARFVFSFIAESTSSYLELAGQREGLGVYSRFAAAESPARARPAVLAAVAAEDGKASWQEYLIDTAVDSSADALGEQLAALLPAPESKAGDDSGPARAPAAWLTVYLDVKRS